MCTEHISVSTVEVGTALSAVSSVASAASRWPACSQLSLSSAMGVSLTDGTLRSLRFFSAR